MNTEKSHAIESAGKDKGRFRALCRISALVLLLAAAGAAAAAPGTVATMQAGQVAPSLPGVAQIIAPNPPPALPPGWCYSDAIGTYPCHFQMPPWWPFDAASCPDGYVLDPATGKCINDQLSVPRPVPAGRDRN